MAEQIGDTNGRLTCYSHNALLHSVIDYALVDNDILSESLYFRVDKLTTYSDHCPIYLRLNANFILTNTVKTEKHTLLPPPTKFIWDENASDRFKSSGN